MFRIEPEHVKFLSQRAATDFGLTEWDPVYKETMDLAEARKLSLSRQEFMARRIRALGSCYWLRTSINDAINDWMDFYTGVMTNSRQAPSPPVRAAARASSGSYNLRCTKNCS
jgi:hypothetical protein